MKKSGLTAVFALAAAFVIGGGVGYEIVHGHTGSKGAVETTIGSRARDLTVYAGISPATHRPFYTTPADAHGTYAWDGAQRYCSALEAFGHHDWRDPTKDELAVEFQNRAAIGGFNETGLNPAGWYWSSSPGKNLIGVALRFTDGRQDDYDTGLSSSLRCVR